MGFIHSASTIPDISGLQTALDGKLTQTAADGLYSALGHTHAFAALTSKPTTIAGYGITDFNSLGDARYSQLGHTHTFASLTSKPTTLAGYGITDGLTQSQTDALYSVLAHTHTFASLTSKPTTIAGYGITDFNSLGDARWAALAHNQAWSTITSTPTTIGGYGITDFNSLGDARWSALAHTHTFASLTSIPTTIGGYGITDAYTKTAGDARYGLVGQANTWAGAQTISAATGPSLSAAVSDAATTATANVIMVKHNTSSTAAAGFGSTIAYQADSTTTPNRDVGAIACSWLVATDASRKGLFAFSVYDTTTLRECMRLSCNGVAPTVGFLGAAAVARQIVSGSIASGAAFLSMKTALVNLGLITDSTTA